MASSASIEVMGTGMGTLGALGVGVESLECPPTSRTMSSLSDKSKMNSLSIPSISILVELDSEKAGLSVSSFLPLEIVVWP